jgi:glycosyltransferase involved in cell wall biosynthesis
MTTDLEVTGVSVVVPSHGRVRMVESLLGSLATARSNAGLRTEVLIVDSSPAAEARLIREACEHFAARYLSSPVNDVRRKRNLGIDQAVFSVVLFIDSDCRALPELIAEHAHSYEDGVAGVLGFTDFVGRDSWTWKITEKTSMLDPFRAAQTSETVPWGPTCNLSFRKEVLTAVGAFATNLPAKVGGEDVDLGLRVTDSGHTIRCNVAAVVEHERETWASLRLMSVRLFRWGQVHFHLIDRHRHRVIGDLPKMASLFLLLLPVALAATVIHRRAALLLLPAAWLGLAALIETALIYRVSSQQLADFTNLLGARIFGLIFDFGNLLEGLRRGSLKAFYQEIYYARPSVHSRGRNRRLAEVWACVLALILLLLASVAMS